MGARLRIARLQADRVLGGSTRSQKQRPARRHLSQGMHVPTISLRTRLSRLCTQHIRGLHSRRRHPSPRATKATPTSPRLCDRRRGVTGLLSHTREDRALPFRMKTKGKSIFYLFVHAALIFSPPFHKATRCTQRREGVVDTPGCGVTPRRSTPTLLRLTWTARASHRVSAPAFRRARTPRSDGVPRCPTSGSR